MIVEASQAFPGRLRQAIGRLRKRGSIYAGCKRKFLAYNQKDSVLGRKSLDVGRLREPVTYAQFRQQDLGLRRILLDLPSKLADKNSKIVGVMCARDAPDFLEQMLVSNDATLVLGEHLKQSIFLRRQLNPGAFDRHAPSG